MSSCFVRKTAPLNRIGLEALLSFFRRYREIYFEAKKLFLCCCQIFGSFAMEAAISSSVGM